MEGGVARGDAAAAAETANVLIMPWFLGGPWVPKFGDKERQISLVDWRMQMETLIRAQNLSQVQQVDFVLSALQGEARREILLLATADRDNPAKIFKALEEVYGEPISVVQLRARFFTCKQQTGEEVGAFILRLRECLAKWRSREPRDENADNDDEMLRSQLVAGLRPGPLQTELQKLLRRNPDLKFADVSKEAKAVEQEQSHSSEETSVRRTYVPPPAPAPAKTTEDLKQMRETLKAEVLLEVKEQISSLKESILGEIRQQFQEYPPPQPPIDQQSSRNRGRWDVRAPSQRHRERTPRWDDQGRPICLCCSRPGHMQRECLQQQATSQGF